MPRRTPRPSPAVAFASVLLGLVAIFGISFVAPEAASAAEPTEGIDISHWQGEIDWTQVRAAGKEFAFMKASEDIDFVDTTYGPEPGASHGGRVRHRGLSLRAAGSIAG